MTKPKKWHLIGSEDISPSSWFPLERRTYKLPDGKVVDDFYVTTIADVTMIVPITEAGKMVLIRVYKQGADDLMIQFPAGRTEQDHKNIQDTAVHELEEETGIKVPEDSLEYLAKLTGFSTKATETVHVFLVTEAVFNSQQRLDETEDIEVLEVTPAELENMIKEGTIWCAQTIACWYLLKQKHPELL